MTAHIAPSILSFNHAEIRPRVLEMAQAGAQVIHLDIMDGQFVPPITFGAGIAAGLSDIKGPLFEAHLMTLTPEAHFEAFAEAGCKRIIFHAEATAHAHRLAGHLTSMGIQPGIAINPGTPAQVVEPVLGIVDLVLVMTVNPGWGGQNFIATALDKVRYLRGLRPDLNIEVDGGIDPVTLPVAREAGANLFVIGSYIAKQKDIGQAVKDLEALCG